MASNEQSVTLLRMNKRAQVEALRSLGFDVGETAKASGFPAMVRWAAGLLDLTVAANRIGDNRKFFFSPAEWLGLSYTEQSGYLLRGIRVRAWGQSFIVAPDNITDKQWGANVAVPDAHNFSAKRDLYAYWDAEEECRAAVSACEGKTGGNGVTGCPAIEAALNYKAFTLERDGLEDESLWLLPTQAHLNLMFHFRTEIEGVFTQVWAAQSKFLDKGYWACNSWSATEGSRLYFNSGDGWVGNKSDSFNVRPITLS